jgi:hypothetical protein
VAVYQGGAVEAPPEKDIKCGQARTVLEALRGRSGGYFVELGVDADDAPPLSTLALEQKPGWRGLCINADPRYLQRPYHRQCQPVHAAVEPAQHYRVGRGGEGEAKMGPRSMNKSGAGENGITGGAARGSDGAGTPARLSLGRLLKDLSAPPVIDYLSLPAGAAGLEDLPADGFTFLTLTVQRPPGALSAALRGRDYLHVCDHNQGEDEFWVHKSLPGVEAVAQLHGLPESALYEGLREGESRPCKTSDECR